jgi:patatin-like phospholipase/acyl hydrolase
MRRLRILSLDGGGLRGIFTLRLLQALERECRQPIQELFDYVIGTSTGGILALALFHCGFTIEECVDLYRELGAEAFQRWKVGAGRAHAYDHNKLEALLRAKLGERKLTAPSTTHVAVVAHRWDQAPNRVAIFANYDIDPSASRFERAPRSAAVWEAARATSAAPTYFEPCTIRADGAARQYVDGGLVANRAAQESEFPNFKGSDLGHFPLVSADFWTSDYLSERSRSVDVFTVTRARGTLTLKRG